jgi:hypothetical protein
MCEESVPKKWQFWVFKNKSKIKEPAGSGYFKTLTKI